MIEVLDVVNKSDKVIGAEPRSTIYQKKLRHRIVHVLLFNEHHEMALQLRSKKVSFCPGHWSTAVGGHVRTGESYEQAALREFKEELGASTSIELFSKDFYMASGLEKFLVVYKATYNGPFKINKAEVEKVEYFSEASLRSMVFSGEKFHPELLFLLNKYFI